MGLNMRAPVGIVALALFFGVGALISATACVSLLAPGSPLEPMWRLNPRAHDAFQRLGSASPAVLGVVSVACASAAAGLAWRRRWGHRLAVALLGVNLLGDVLNVALGVEPRALVGVPIVAALLWYLTRPRVSASFETA
jgi:hypothetical protein